MTFAAERAQVGEFDVLTPLRRSGELHMLSPTQLYNRQ
jgi:hypothetical protein